MHSLQAWIERSTFTANAVNNSGGAIALAASAVQMYDCHLYGNRAGGGAAGGAGLFADSWSAAGGGVFALGCIAPMQVRVRTRWMSASSLYPCNDHCFAPRCTHCNK